MNFPIITLEYTRLREVSKRVLAWANEAISMIKGQTVGGDYNAGFSLQGISVSMVTSNVSG